MRFKERRFEAHDTAPLLKEAGDEGLSPSTHFDQSAASPIGLFYRTYVEPESGVAFCLAPFGEAAPTVDELRETLARHPRRRSR